ncbi:MAG: hypothetical protein QGG31_05290, partial [Anaerolineales bacterium]|nr:hypothetical protein [Anaerolineales bacterium]
MTERVPPPARTGSEGGYVAGGVRICLLLVVVAAATYLRFVGLNWDEFQHLHPDERFLTMVVTGIRPVEGGWSEYFDSGNST